MLKWLTKKKLDWILALSSIVFIPILIIYFQNYYKTGVMIYIMFWLFIYWLFGKYKSHNSISHKTEI